MKLPFVKDKPWPEEHPYPGYQAYPRSLYHHKFAPEGKVFKSPEETAGLKRKGWVDSPAKFPKPSRLSKQKPWWERWEWLFKAAGIVLAGIAAIVTVIAALLRAIR